MSTQPPSSGSEPPPSEKRKSVKDIVEKVKTDETINKSKRYVWEHWLEFVTGGLMVLGVIFAFFYLHIGGILIGLGVGICFAEEIQGYLLRAKDFFSVQGVFRSLMVVGTALYLLLAAPAFIIAAAIGFGGTLLVHWALR